MRSRVIWAWALASMLASQSLAVTSRIYRHTTGSDFLKGKAEQILISSRGTMQLGRAAERLTEPFDQVWSVNSIVISGGAIYFGTSPNGGIYRYDFGALTQLYPLDVELPGSLWEQGSDSNDLDRVANEHVFALGTDITGRLLAGFSGRSCRLCRFSTKGVEVIFEPKDALYIFDICTDDAGNIYVASGPEGKVYRLDPLGKTAQLLYNSRDKNILSLVAGTETVRLIQEGNLDAGVIACSQSIGIVGEIRPLADVIEGMVQQAEGIQQGLMAQPTRPGSSHHPRSSYPCQSRT